jgi:hypothetical protein
MAEPKCLEDLLECPPVERLGWLAEMCQRSANRCDENMITKNTWMSETFKALAEIMRQTVDDIEMDQQIAEYLDETRKLIEGISKPLDTK